ncbi:MAG: Rieske (2Fe-2S) protein [Acidiphilium sp.]|nr:Rieske (2Fe-2S) protein [Acidiphilium sp.]MDD4934593.1 Rieske (2Fe-2S) protein [Acidiphilium sp.]
MAWIDAVASADLYETGRVVAKIDGQQILLVVLSDCIVAVDNRCPHQGYPLAEGTVQGCRLTCHWHHWVFDLESGETLVGEDRLRRYPVRVNGARVEIDCTPPDPATRLRSILADLEVALVTRRQGRILREAARYLSAGGDAADLIRHAVAWAGERLEFGTSHAIAAIPDWLAVSACPETTEDEKLVALGEVLGHIADDAFGRPPLPFAALSFATAPTAWDPTAFRNAVEATDEATALALIRAGLEAHVPLAQLRTDLARAALDHYADFGHALIYTVKTVDLIERLDDACAEPLLAMLIRSLVYATREDLLPEFAIYRPTLAAWADAARTPVPLGTAALRGKRVRHVLPVIGTWAAHFAPEPIFAVLVEQAAWMLLHADTAMFDRVDVPPAQSVNWLDLTHAITFAEAGWRVARCTPDLWPAVLLQIGCFLGRNAGFVTAEADISEHFQPDPEAFLRQCRHQMFDHGRDRFIISAHLLKTLGATEALAATLHAQAPLLIAALHRFVTTPIRPRHTLRAARQTLELVGRSRAGT